MERATYGAQDRAARRGAGAIHRNQLTGDHYMTRRRTFIKRVMSIAGAMTVSSWLGMATPVHAADTIKVGVLHSLSGTMAISETVLKDVTLMAIEEINSKGGVLGKKLEAVVVDPASNWPLFAE